MGLAFDVEPTPSRIVARIRAATRLLTAAGFGVAGWQLTSGPTAVLSGPEALRSAIAAVLLLTAAGFLTAAARALRSGCNDGVAQLAVDDEGRCRIRFAGSDVQPAELARAHILPGLILVALTPRRGGAAGPSAWRSRTLLLGRDSMPDHPWRCLGVWLRWMSRGRHDRPTGWK